MKDLENHVIPSVCPMWREVGIQLDLDVTILNVIDEEYTKLARKCSRMFEEWLKQDVDASWSAVLNACTRVKENLASGPDESRTKDHVEALCQLSRSLPAFLTTL